MTSIDDLVNANRSYAAYAAIPAEGRPSQQLAVLTCMDTRLDPLAGLGLAIGQAHVIRNAGGLVTDDALRSLAISQRALGTRSVVVLHHTRCGMQGFDDVQFRADCAADADDAPAWDVPGFTDPVEQVRESLARLRSCGWLLHHDDVRGFVWDVDSGRISEVD